MLCWPAAVRLHVSVSVRLCFCCYSTIKSSCCRPQTQLRASVAKPWTKLRLQVYIFNHRPGTTLMASETLTALCLIITLTLLLIFFMALILITSWNEASGEQMNARTKSKNKTKPKTSRCNLIASTDHPELNYTPDVCVVMLCLTCSCFSCSRDLLRVIKGKW